MIIEELDVVELIKDLPMDNLKKGDRGTVVHLFEYSNAFEVEFSDAKGRTIRTIPLLPDDVKMFAKQGKHIENSPPYEYADVKIWSTDPKSNFCVQTSDLSGHDIENYSRKRGNMMTVIKNFFPDVFWSGYNHFSKTGEELGIEFY